MVGKTRKKSANVAKQTAAKRVAANVAQPRMSPRSQSSKAAKLTLLSGGNPQIARPVLTSDTLVTHER